MLRGLKKILSASKYKFVPVFGPLNHELYVNETILRERFWPEHRPKNINVSFQDFEVSNRSFGCESPWYGQTNNFNNSFLTPEPRNRFPNVCYSGNASTPWKENDSFDFGNNYDQRRSFGFESTFNSPNPYTPPGLFEQRLGSDFKPRNFNVCVENGFRNVRPFYSPPQDSFNSSLSPVPYNFRTQHTVEIKNMNNDCLIAQRKLFTESSPFYDSSSSINNYYSSPAVLSYCAQDASRIQDVSMTQIDGYSAFRGKSFDHSLQDSSGYESFTSTPRRALLPNPFRNRSPLVDINNIVNRRDSFEGYQQTSNYLQSPGPIRKKNNANKKRRKKQKPYKRHEV
ncbi:uncharacterized protein TNIN_480331 [Trichonephila inaurata madagascariensis]|uniref:Uncharacterized protein n=1 Tax=Trichonephila inaurata madagascariensis TaxID=2747483 RepID=A0A8X7C8R3_9ARAC|nr:uncharacterized protein TNIN_480331 [Trichonephila inaurata madagascariensis]